MIAACECGLHRDHALSPSVCLCGANISESPTSLWQFRQMFRRSLVQECPGIKYACSGVKRVTSLRSRWIAMNICARGGLMPSTSPLRFSVSTRLYFLPTVSRERAIAESTGEPLHSEADFYFLKKRSSRKLLKHPTQIWVWLLTARCLLEILCRRMHTHTHT